jgi:hypothetical protein
MITRFIYYIVSVSLHMDTNLVTAHVTEEVRVPMYTHVTRGYYYK